MPAAVADALGMTRILIHPLAGVLSAYGIGLADVKAIRERSWIGRSASDFAEALAELEASARSPTWSRRGSSARAIATDRRARLRAARQRHDRSRSTVAPTAMRAAFDTLHRQRFGYAEPSASRWSKHWWSRRDLAAVRGGPCAAWSRARRQDRAPRRHRWPSPCREELAGPALILEPSRPSSSSPAGPAAAQADGTLILTRTDRPRSAPLAAGTDADPVRLEIFNNLFMAIAEEMGVALQATATSVNIKERLDFSCALFDATAR